MKQKDSHRTNRIIAYVIALLLLIGCILFILLEKKEKGSFVAIYEDNKLIKRYSLNDVDKPFVYHYVRGDGHNDIEISKDGVRVISADCPDEICYKKGYIKNVNESIICVPHKLLVIIEGDAKVEVDEYAY